MIAPRSLTAIAVTTMFLVLLTGCNRNPLTPLLSKSADSYECQMVEPSSAGNHVTVDDRLASVGEEFGGYFYDREEDVLNVYMLNPSNREAAEKTQTKLSQFLNPKIGEAGLRVLRAEYTAAQLNKWKDLSTNIVGLDGVVMQDLDESKNRLLFGILNTSPTQSVRECVHKNADNLGIPQEAVDVVERPAASRL